MSETRRLTDGTYTTSARRYVADWRALGAVVAAAHGPDWVCFAFDPDISICDRNSVIDVDIRTARAIRRLTASTPAPRKRGALRASR